VIFARLRSGARQIDDLTTSSRQILQKLKIVADKLSDTTNTAGLILQDPGTAREIRSTLRSLQSASEKLDENMDALKDNFLLRGYFKRKEKQVNNK
jgi:phospholipid/cholesterol/gamma-HCH transport system substrate-binding protein